MTSTLTFTERRVGIILAILTCLLGLIMAVAANQGPMAVHGYIAMALGLYLVFVLSGSLYDHPEPPFSRLTRYCDAPVRFGVIMTLIWAVVGMAVGLWLATLMYWPEATPLWPATSYGRLRPVHTSGVIFGFGGNALIATSLYIVQRTTRARLADGFSPWFVLIGFNLFCVWAATGYLMGQTQSKEYAEPEWYADLLLLIVWVVYFVLYMRTLARRAEPHIYVSNWWFLAFIVVVAMLHIVNNLAIPVTWNSGKSYTIWSGVQDAMIQWWYGHNAVAFFLTAGFLGMLYYFLPVRAGRPIWSYRLSIVSFWGIVFFYMWAGSHHLHYTALPYWVQTLGMTFSVMLLVPSWASAGNAILTLNGAWHKVRDDATLRFMFVAAVFYGLVTFEGSFMAIRPVNSLSHYTDWTVGHVHSGTLGWVAMIVFGALYTLVPKLYGRETMAWPKAVEWHFWLAVSGTLIYVISLWNAGIVQGLMWRAYDDGGGLAYSFLESMEAMLPYYALRTLGGGLFLVGAILCALNCRATMRADGTVTDASDRPLTAAQAAE
ncbi:cytochrome-c oxidase, cbb3-type subunit I [Roseinatronobacter sp. S2]|uniref:cytochrome-c oxidase, cbb3-type subunit I n=1 Tax=Roseinatronobacter sp. S2 TaxID=3035471 RepID=UPI00240F28A8|nr:cytochrome-c oxidase, cbb3-type subunit I [Roseinatronobacter sp. S2]WFE77273.1 cytochrome-c oxidase, cbb3-type subunit I [Roseinatronobacter sp. S2]